MTIDGKHERVLCEIHAAGIREAMQSPGTYKVTWGLNTTEKIAFVKSKIAAIVAVYGEPPDDFSLSNTPERQVVLQFDGDDA